MEIIEFLGKWAFKHKGTHLIAYRTDDLYVHGTSLSDMEIFIVYKTSYRKPGTSLPQLVIQSQASLKYLAPGGVSGVGGALAAKADLETTIQFTYNMYAGTPNLLADLGNGTHKIGMVKLYDGSLYYLGYANSESQFTPDMSYEVIYTTPSIEQLVEKSRSGQNGDFRNVVFPAPSLTGLNFQGANFSSASLSPGSFEGSDMREARFVGAYIEGMTFRGCDLTGADFTGAVFAGALDLTDCNLTGAKLPEADLSRAVFSPKTILRGATLTGAHLDTRDLTGVDFSDADLQRATFSGANLSGANLAGADLSHTDLTTVISSSPAVCSADPQNRTKFVGARLNFPLLEKNWSCLDLSDTLIDQLPRDEKGRITLDHLAARDSILTHLQLPGASLKYAQFDNSFLTGTNLTGADLSNASLKSAWLEGTATTGEGAAHLSGANLFNADLSSAQLSGVDFSGAYLYGQSASVAGATMKQVKLALAYLASMNFSNVDLRGADLAYACLVNAKFVGANLSEYQTTDLKAPTSLFKACMQGADFSQSTLNGADLNDAAIATTSGSISVTLSYGEPYTRPLTYPNPTILPQSATNSSTVCPNGTRGPCAASQLTSDEAPTQWPPKEMTKKA